MPQILRMSALVSLLAAPVLATATEAGPVNDQPHTLGPHPAIVVQRLQSGAGYDYTSKFYPHPAWLYLRAAPPADEASTGTTAQRLFGAARRFDATTDERSSR